MKRKFVLLGLVALSATAQADVKMPAMFGDNMILQRGVRVPIWGEAAPGEKVTVKFFNQTKQALADDTGRWKLALDPLDVLQSETLQINGNNEIKINNVAVGEVWIASGQSNMEWVLRNTHDLPNALNDANDPQLRLFTVQKATSDKPLADVKGKWQASTPEVAPAFSAVGWYFGRELRKKLNVPVGVINTSWGGTAAEAWTSNAALSAEADFKPMLDNWEKRVADHPAAMERYNTVTLPAWEEARKKAKEEGKPDPQRPRAPEGGTGPNRPANLYNAMIAPLVPYSVKGAIWYQGESNSGRAYQYRKLLPTMIADWRRAWGVEKPQDFGFYIVQLANFMAPRPEPVESNWAELREAQTMTALMPGNGQALAIDIGEEKDIHPRNKRDVGLRLAAAALAQTYGQKIPYSGPLYDTMTVEGNKIRLKFKHTDGGLVNKNADANVLPGFAIAGADKKWKWANAKIEGNDIVVWNDEITAPVAVRYAWADNPKATLYNGAGFPAVPFRTDDWPGNTVNNK